MGTKSGELVVVTGASGFIGSHVVKTLLERGYRVRGTVRDSNNESKTAWIRKLVEGTSGSLELVTADLMDPLSLEKAIEGAPYVLHTAAVVKMQAKNPQKDIVDAAVEGTRNVLAAVLKAKTVKKLVMTSSVVAVRGNPPLNGTAYTEQDWNEKYLNLRNPYNLGKTEAERLAWKTFEEQPAEGPRFELVTICPAFVLGPLLHKQHISTSPQLIQQMMNGQFPLAPNFFFNVVDVREVALAHVLSFEKPEASGRFLLVTDKTFHSLDLAAVVREKYPNLKTPKHAMPNFLLYIFTLFHPTLTRDFVGQLIEARSYDSSRSEAVLGVKYRPDAESILDTADSILELDLLTAKI